MKKLMVVMAVAFAAACSHAASVSWTVTGTAAEKGLTVYVVESLAAFTSEADIANYLLGTEGNSGTFAGTRTIQAAGTVGGLDDAKSGEMQSFYYVVVNSEGTGYWASDATTAEIYTTATTHTDSKVAASTFVTGEATSWSAVPEPTSGVLLLLGVAGLALRRKQK